MESLGYIRLFDSSRYVITPGLSATLTQSRYVRVARYSGTIATQPLVLRTKRISTLRLDRCSWPTILLKPLILLTS